ncbi:MAG: iron-sulfur cluster repair di-iron protein [Verrucomicrobiota bacterium]
MSHSTVSFSPAGTPLLDRTVGELVAERPGRSRIFQTAGIDFCCQGGRTLREACERKGVPSALIVGQLEAEFEDKAPPVQNPAELPPDKLAAYIVETHHDYLRKELPRLHAMSERVANVHGGHTPSLVEVFQIFLGVEEELGSHMMKEEQILFPAVVKMSRGEVAPMLLDGPIACMIHEHDEVGTALARMQKLTNGYQPPVEACNTYRALFAGLKDLEEDLHRHIHLENSVLFPAAQAMFAAAA